MCHALRVAGTVIAPDIAAAGAGAAAAAAAAAASCSDVRAAARGGFV
jgi:hypothetical protein